MREMAKNGIGFDTNTKASPKHILGKLNQILSLFQEWKTIMIVNDGDF
jgi:hypothetical protein